MTPYQKQMALYARRWTRIDCLRATGWTLQRIADKYGISRQRVGQLLRRGK